MSGFVGTVSPLVFFPYIQRRYNNRSLYTFFVSFWVIVFAMMPLGHLAALTKKEWVIWLSVAGILVPVRLTANANMWVFFPSNMGLMSFQPWMLTPMNIDSLNFIIIKASADRKDELGSLFGLQQSCSSIARTIAPAFVSMLFAITINKENHNWLMVPSGLVWIVMGLASLLVIRLSGKVRDVPAPPMKWI